MKRFCCIATIFAAPSLLSASSAFAGRPPEALLADRAAAEAEVHDLERRARALEEQSQERKERLKKRLRALYKLANGGSLRLLVEGTGKPLGTASGQPTRLAALGSPMDVAAEMAARHDAIRRVLARDLDELAAVREEARELDAEQARRQDALTRAMELDRQIASQPEPAGLAARIGRLPRPVPGPILHSFGGYKDRGIEVARRGAEMQTQAGQTVRAVAAARVAWVGEAPGIGPAVALDHGEGYLTLYGRIRPTVSAGELVVEGGAIGRALGSNLYFELAQDGTALDPAPWMKKPL